MVGVADAAPGFASTLTLGFTTAPPPGA